MPDDLLLPRTALGAPAIRIPHRVHRIARTGLTIVAALSFTAFFGVRMRPPPEDSRYVGSASCESCHEDVAATWQASLHTKMMRPATRRDVVLADFSEDDPHRGFDLDEVVWVIGGKWEQQFMGHDGAGETLLPGAWLGAAARWDFKGWDGWEEPEPLKRCHGCHTVGLDVEAGTFTEPNIGCESCHGPASWHQGTRGLGRIHSSADPQVCGQCHNRGTSTDGLYHFPVGYRPGRNLADHFVPNEPSPGNNSSSWWGNGHERKRHQEYQAWSQGGHADALRSLREGYDGRYGAVTDDCLECHSGDYILGGRARPSVEDARYGITCAVCHHVHGELDRPRMGCADCHGDGAYHHEPERNARHVPCPAEASVDCVSCHMPKTAKTGGAFQLHSHRAGVIAPEDVLRWGGPTSCANGSCHVDAAPEALQASYEAFYRPPVERLAAREARSQPSTTDGGLP